MNAKEFIQSKGSTLTHNQMQGIAVIMEQYADHKTEELQKEVERLKEKEEVLKGAKRWWNKRYLTKKKENKQLKQENKELIEGLEKILKIGYYKAHEIEAKIEELLTKINKDEK
jgi:hypothetical protein